VIEAEVNGKHQTDNLLKTLINDMSGVLLKMVYFARVHSLII